MKVLLEVWARSYFDPPPSAFTLRRLAREGAITPAPVKVGRAWYVDQSARLVGDRPSLVDRLRGGL